MLRVISGSPGELEPVFQAMLENAVRICEAKFGVLFQSEGEALRAVEGFLHTATSGAAPGFFYARSWNPAHANAGKAGIVATGDRADRAADEEVREKCA